MIEGAIGGIVGAFAGFMTYPFAGRQILLAAARRSRRLGVPPEVLADGTKILGLPPGLLGRVARFNL